MTIPESRVRSLNDGPVKPDGRYVLYWMVAARRARANFALDYAVQWARELSRPLVVLEAVRIGYPWASRRLHQFLVEGMAANAEAFADTAVTYYPYLEPEAGKGSGLLEALAADACLVVSDDYPSFFIPRMQAKVAPRLPVRLDVIDSNGMLPLSLARGRSFYSAYLFRRFLQNNLAPELLKLPAEAPLAPLAGTAAYALPKAILERFPPLSTAALRDPERTVRNLPVDADVAPVRELRGGSNAGHAALRSFLDHRLARYGEGRSHPDDDAASGLSPWLHFGHLGAHEVFRAVCKKEKWNAVPSGPSRDGRREQFWGISASAEAFLEEFIVFRELAFNTAATMPDFDRYESLPEWARNVLEERQADARTHLYDLATLEAARTHDPVWNAAQRQLATEGRIHNYMRMLWGKKLLEWSATPREALTRAVHLNNKYALDGRDPNSYGGIFWIFGRYDRPWAPARPIYGTIRYMSSDAARKKLRMSRYLARWSGQQLPMDLHERA